MPSEQISIRLLEEDDIEEAIATIHRASKANKDHYPDEFIDLLNKMHYSVKWLEETLKTRDYFIATVDGKIVGIASHKDNEVRNVFVDYSYQGMGIGGKLMEKVENALREKGYSKAKLASNLTSKQFYIKLGYKIIEEKNEKIREWDIVGFDMEKEL